MIFRPFALTPSNRFVASINLSFPKRTQYNRRLSIQKFRYLATICRFTPPFNPWSILRITSFPFCVVHSRITGLQLFKIVFWNRSCGGRCYK